MAEREVFVYMDMHGHSRKHNIFCYGCDDRKKPRPAVRIYPKLLSWNRLGRNYVSFDDCSFTVRKNREATARVVIAKELDTPNAYTIEASFSGADFGPLKGHHFNIGHLQEAGAAVCDSLIDYLFPNAAHRTAVLQQPSSSMPDQCKGLDNEAEVEEVTHQVEEEMKISKEGDDLSSESDGDNEQQQGASAAQSKDRRFAAVRQLPGLKTTTMTASSNSVARASSSGNLSGGTVMRGGGGALLKRRRVGSLSSRGSDSGVVASPSRSPCVLHQQEMRLRRAPSIGKGPAARLPSPTAVSNHGPTKERHQQTLLRRRRQQRGTAMKQPKRPSGSPGSLSTSLNATSLEKPCPSPSPALSSTPKGGDEVVNEQSLDTELTDVLLAKLRLNNKSKTLAGLGGWGRKSIDQSKSSLK